MDKYNIQIERLTAIKDQREFEDNICSNWSDGTGLFQFCSKTDDASGGLNYGCLTMIRDNPDFYVSDDIELTARIANDERLPSNFRKITAEHLPVFAEYQREMDKMWPGRSAA